MSAAELYAMKIREVLEEVKHAGLEISGYSDCCGCSRDIVITVTDKTHSEDVKVS